MKKGNITILASIFIMALVTAGVSVGTQAWFSTEAETTGVYSMNAATMDMIVTASSIDFSNLVPGEELSDITITIQNDGTMDIGYLCGSMTMTGSVALADMIIVEEWWEYIPGEGWTENVDPGADQQYWLYVGDGIAPLTLLEVVQSYSTGRGEPYDETAEGHDKVDQFGKYKMYASDWISGGGYDQTEGPAIIEDGEYQMVFRLKFSEDAGNDLQGASASFTITFQGLQDLSLRP